MQTEIKYLQALLVYRSRVLVRPGLGFATGLAGIANMVAAIVPKPNWDMLLGVWPVDTHHGAYKLTVIVGFFLLMLLHGLLRGKREAWCTTVILLLLSVFLHILYGGQVLVTIITGVVLTLLVVSSRSFRARSDSPSIWRGYIALLAGLGIVTLYTVGGFFFLYDQLEPFVDRYGIEKVLLRLFTNSHLGLTHGTQAFFFGRALPVLCLSAVLYGIVMICVLWRQCFFLTSRSGRPPLPSHTSTGGTRSPTLP